MGLISLEEIMKHKYSEIERNFRCASAKINLNYDCDIFCETYLKCCDALKDKDLDEKKIIQYFWVSFTNNSRKQYRVSKYKPKMCEVDVNVPMEDNNYDENKYEIYDIINQSIYNKFGSKMHSIWSLHFIENKTYDELVKLGYDDVNFHNLFRKITSYIKTKLPKENKTYKKLLIEAFN